MSVRVYVLLDVVQEELAEVARTLRCRPGVAMVDVLEGPPDIIMVVEARGRRRLAELTIEAISSIENMTKELRLLPVTEVRGLRRMRTSVESHAAAKANTTDVFRDRKRTPKESQGGR
ncbi:MAG: hypothetical protein V1932_02180 [Chloroflexota bacterium]